MANQVIYGVNFPDPALRGSGDPELRRVVSDWQNAHKVKYGFGAIGDESSGIDWSKFLQELPSNIRQIWTAYTQAELQSQLLELNIQRAGQGLPLIKMPGISVGASTETLLVVGGGIALIALAIMSGKRRR